MFSSLPLMSPVLQKIGLVDDYEGVEQQAARRVDLLNFRVSQPDCSPQELAKCIRDYQNIIRQVQTSVSPFKPSEIFQNQTQTLATLLHERCTAWINEVAEKCFVRWQEKKSFLRQQVLDRAFPKDAEEISSFIIRQISNRFLQNCLVPDFTGKSLCFPYFTASGEYLIIKYRIQNNKPQIIVSKKVGEGNFEEVTKIAVVAGPSIKGAPDRIFARLKLKEMWKQNPEIVRAVCLGVQVSQQLNQHGAKSIVQYDIISERTGGVTLAAPLYKENVLHWLSKFPLGADSVEAVQEFLGKIAIPAVTALCSLHSENLVHLDFRAENLLLSEKGELGLGDLATCKEVSSFYRNSFIPFYAAAPEIFEDQGYSVDPKLDIYACGVLITNFLLGLSKGSVLPTRKELFSLLSPEQQFRFKDFRPPVELEELLSLLTQEQKLFLLSQGVERVKKDLVSLSEKYGYLHELCSLTCRLLSKQPEDRPTAQELLTELQHIQNSL